MKIDKLKMLAEHGVDLDFSAVNQAPDEDRLLLRKMEGKVAGFNRRKKKGEANRIMSQIEDF